MAELDYTVATDKPVDEAIQALQSALAERKFSALWHLHVNEKLREKGFHLEPDFHIFEVCNPAKAKQALETDQKVGYLLPCKIVVYADRNDGNRTKIGLLRPQTLIGLLDDERLRDLANEVEQELRAAVDAAAR
ncbi:MULTISPECIES: DUF302 domain-containing protein [Thermaerobacter]|uniref:DUF302 domain-containing protein n=1 Tax=Thermaerobacter composti TaxID=554949 RepID=A0ABZ0QPE4_9FIRM|nr:MULTISPECIES: DUF302 domain-containing protein [Thermaerobacter]PZN09295.1 MAG: hypothetical protein DIU76_00650 [Bacillota bacterium]QBS37272.1 DUF302 domain-containing protein [Thermaerobacter sp. FW80]WPD19296.1 DUF302 domain-containing protein [Thermaerobacter composti]